MAEVVRAATRFRHLQIAVGGLRREALPARVDWLLLDVNLAPQVALHAVRRVVPMVRRTLRGAFLTLKLNEDAFAAEIPAFLERIRGYGFEDVRATQLPSNRSEICVVARPRARGGRATQET
jgi:23S rRNA (cytidine2498-2'-O)-methyltransferase